LRNDDKSIRAKEDIKKKHHVYFFHAKFVNISYFKFLKKKLN